MYAKIEITGKLEVKTGLHIGANGAFSAIGAVDSPVVKDAVTGLPMIPGSSLKGKMRALLAKQYNVGYVADKPEKDTDCIKNLFGCGGDKVKPSRLLFSDMIMENWEELKKLGLTSKTEIKFENSINRASAVANPRQIERVVRGSVFPLSLIYELDDKADMKKDFEIIANGMRLLEYDYLGGNGSRGYGKVKFEDIQLKVVVGEVDEKLVEECQNQLIAK